MKEIEELTTVHGNLIREAVTEFFVPLQTIRVIKTDAFVNLSNAIETFAKDLKGHEMVPKSLLNEIYMSAQILRNEAPYFTGKTDVLEKMADKIEMVFGLILIGESSEDRVPGVPRIR